jgi:hypothetical protein
MFYIYLGEISYCAFDFCFFLFLPPKLSYVSSVNTKKSNRIRQRTQWGEEEEAREIAACGGGDGDIWNARRFKRKKRKTVGVPSGWEK